jgi:superfamily I DNA/RNA helicase
VNLEDSLAWWTLLHLRDGIGERVRDHFHAAAEANRQTFAAALLSQHEAGYPGLTVSQRTKVQSVVAPTLALIEAVNVAEADMGAAGWGTWLAARAEEFGGCEQRFRDLLIEVDSLVDPDEGLARFLGQIQPIGKDLRSGRAAGAVRLMSMTASKGLTVRAAIIMGVEDGVVPLAKRDPGEERRLLYVAMTRPREFLYLTWAQRRVGPTARTGVPRVRQGRNRSPLLTHGPIPSEDGQAYLQNVGA